MQGLYNDTVTVFNCVKGGKGISKRWLPTVLEGVEIQGASASRNTTTGTKSADKVLMFVRFNPSDDSVNGHKYLPPKAWANQEDKSSTFTFADDGDFFVRGSYANEASDDDYEDSGFYDYMNRIYDDVWRITKSEQYKLIPHFEVVGE